MQEMGAVIYANLNQVCLALEEMILIEIHVLRHVQMGGTGVSFPVMMAIQLMVMDAQVHARLKLGSLVLVALRHP